MDTNSLAGMAKDIQIPKAEAEETDINPLTSQERNLIIQAFDQS